MNTSTYQGFYDDVAEALKERRLLDALHHLDALASYMALPPVREMIRMLRQDYALMLSYMKQGRSDADRQRFYHRFLRQTYRLLTDTDRLFRLEYDKGCVAAVWRRLHAPAEAVADIYVPFVEGEGGRPATIVELLADPLVSYQQLFDTVWTSGRWNKEEHDALFQYVMNDEAPFINRMSLVSAVGMAVLTFFDEEKLLFLFSVIEEHEVQVSVRAMVLALLACAQYEDRLELYPDLVLKLRFLRETTYLHPLVVSIQKAFLLSSRTMEMGKMLSSRFPSKAVFKMVTEMTEDITPENFDEMAQVNPEVRKVRDKMVGAIQEYGRLQNLGFDTGYISFRHVSRHIPFFEEVANWFCPFTLDHPLLFNIGPAARFLGLVIRSKSCDTERYSLVFSLAPNMPEVKIIQQDAVTMEQKKIKDEDVDEFVDMLSDHLAQQDQSKAASLLDMDMEDLDALVTGFVHDCYRFFSLYGIRKGSDKGDGDEDRDDEPLYRNFGNPFDHNLEFFRSDYLHDIFDGPTVTLDLAHFLFDTGDYNTALTLYYRLEGDYDVYHHMAICSEQLKMPELAILHYERALEHKPDDEDLQARLAILYVENDDCESALPIFVKLDYLYPDNVVYRSGLAWCAMATGDYERADALYMELVGRDDVSNEDVQNAGHCALLHGDYPMATTYYEEYLRRCGHEFAHADFFGSDRRFLEDRGVDADLQRLIIDLLNI